MKNPRLQQSILDNLWRFSGRAPTAAEWEALLQAHPEWRSEIEEERALTEMLQNLPDSPISSNFVAQVMSAAERENRRPSQPEPLSPGQFSWKSWWPRLASIAGLAVLAIISFQAIERQNRSQMAEAIAQVSKLTAGSPLTAWEDFDSISRMPLISEPGRILATDPSGGRMAASPDLELLAAFATGE